MIALHLKKLFFPRTCLRCNNYVCAIAANTISYVLDYDVNIYEMKKDFQKSLEKKYWWKYIKNIFLGSSHLVKRV
jgi:hypothetical protein